MVLKPHRCYLLTNDNADDDDDDDTVTYFESLDDRRAVEHFALDDFLVVEQLGNLGVKLSESVGDLYGQNLDFLTATTDAGRPCCFISTASFSIVYYTQANSTWPFPAARSVSTRDVLLLPRLLAYWSSPLKALAAVDGQQTNFGLYGILIGLIHVGSKRNKGKLSSHATDLSWTVQKCSISCRL